MVPQLHRSVGGQTWRELGHWAADRTFREDIAMRVAQCNYCYLRQLQQQARRKGLFVTLKARYGGTAIFVHPKTRLPNTSDPDINPDSDFTAWFAELGSSCCC